MSTAIKHKIENGCQTTKRDEWFDQFIASIRIDQLQLDAGVASKQKQDFYNSVVNNDIKAIAINGRQEFSKIIIMDIINIFLTELKQRECKPLNLAMQLSPAEILVWATIKDNDEKTEDSLYLSEAKVNSLFNEHGFHISTTILEECDNYPIPSQYSLIPY